MYEPPQEPPPVTSGLPPQYIMNMSEDDPRRMEEIRKYAAIYGRFDCKRKPEKPLTLHEVRKGAIKAVRGAMEENWGRAKNRGGY